MADGQWPRQRFHNGLRRKVVADIAKSSGRIKSMGRVVRHDTTGFLATMLKGVQSKCHKVGRVHGTKDTKNPTLFLKLVAIFDTAQGIKVKRVRGWHTRVGSVGQWAAPNPVNLKVV